MSWPQSNGRKPLAQKQLQSVSLASSKHTWKLNVQLGELKWIGPAHILRLLSHVHANKTHTSTHPRALNQSMAPLSIHISIPGPPNVNKLGNPILYIFQGCQSVRMKCCWPPLRKFLLSILAKCRSSFISLLMTNAWGWEVGWPVRYDAIFRISVSIHEW